MPETQNVCILNNERELGYFTGQKQRENEMKKSIGLNRGRVNLRAILFGIVFLISFGLFSNSALARQYDIYNVPETSSSFAGGYVALEDSNGDLYYHNSDYSSFEPSPFSFLAIYDTGASGMILGNAHATELGIPQTGETYSDEGIGGTETFDVSVPTGLRIAPTSLVNATDNSWMSDPSYYDSYGSYKFQISRRLDIDVMGTPLLAHHIMRVNLDDWRDMSLVSGVTVAKTDLIDTMPTSFGAGKTALPVQINMQDFVNDDSAPISYDRNPIIPNIQIIDDRNAPDNQSSPKDWLFDTGAQLTMIGRNYATEIGIDLDNETPVDSTEIGGVGGNITIYGYRVDELVLPVIGGDELIFHDPIVFVPEEGALPADLTGIFGMNLLSGNLIQDDQGNMFIDPNFAEWYFDPIDSNITFVIPLPSTILILIFGWCITITKRRFNR